MINFIDYIHLFDKLNLMKVEILLGGEENLGVQRFFMTCIESPSKLKNNHLAVLYLLIAFSRQMQHTPLVNVELK